MGTEDGLYESGINAVLDQLSNAFPDLESVLAEQGINTDEVEEVKATYQSFGPGKGCWQVCVRRGGILICFTKCR